MQLFFSRVSEFHLVLVNFVVAGLEIAASVAFTFVPPLLLKSGYSETQMTIIFGVGKITFLHNHEKIKKIGRGIVCSHTNILTVRLKHRYYHLDITTCNKEQAKRITLHILPERGPY